VGSHVFDLDAEEGGAAGGTCIPAMVDVNHVLSAGSGR
jgi:hypothetical protein